MLLGAAETCEADLDAEEVSMESLGRLRSRGLFHMQFMGVESMDGPYLDWKAFSAGPLFRIGGHPGSGLHGTQVGSVLASGGRRDVRNGLGRRGGVYGVVRPPAVASLPPYEVQETESTPPRLSSRVDGAHLGVLPLGCRGGRQ